MKIKIAKCLCVVVLMTILQGCRPIETVIPNPKIPHQIAEKVRVKVWLRKPNGTKQEVLVEFLPGWWVMPPTWGEK